MSASGAFVEGKFINGEAIAALVRREVKRDAAAVCAARGYPPGLAVIHVGSRPDSSAWNAQFRMRAHCPLLCR